jgi:cytochrome c
MEPRRVRSPTVWLVAVLASIAFAACHKQAQPALSVPGGDPARGKQQIVAYGCGSCHIVPGIPGAKGLLGPPLNRFASRAYIAGEVPNNGQFLTQWIAVPQSIEPGTVMPNLGVSEAKARDIAAYLYTLK